MAQTELIRSFVRSCAGVLGAIALAAVCPSRVAAQDAPPQPGAIEWQGPSECPAAGEVRARVDALLGRSAASLPHAPDVGFRAIAIRAVDTWTMRVQTRASGVKAWKTIEAASCQELADAYALIVTFALDPSLRPKDASPPNPRVPSAMVKPPTAMDSPPPKRASRVPVIVAPQVALGVGLLPPPSFGAGLVVAYENRLRWQLGAMYWLEREANTANPNVGGAKVALFVAQPSVCMELGRSVFALCGGGDVGVLSAEGVNIAQQWKGRSWWVAFTAGLSVVMARTRHVDVRTRLDVGIPIFRPRFVLEHVDANPSREVFRPWPLFGVLSLAIDLHGPSTESVVSGHEPMP